MIKKYRSIPFEAFELLHDMSNWREAITFMGLKVSNEHEHETPPPPFLDVPTEYGFAEAIGPCFIAKNPDSEDFEVIKYEDFCRIFEEVK